MVIRRLCFSLLMLVVQQTLSVQGFTFSEVRERARVLSQQPFVAATNEVPATLLNLSYVQYQSIRFRRDKALWAGQRLPFQIEFLLPGSAHKQTILIHEVSDGGARRIGFSAESFDFGTNRLELPSTLGYAGFRILHPVQDFGEVASFVGASYFRMIGRGQVFGASGRWLALNTVLMEKEEFPAFREFWIRKPGHRDRAVTVWALLDSPSTTGAFEWVITPGSATVAHTKASFFPRQEVREFGIAPLTSMFLHDQNSHVPLSDFRPEVHDSDGLLLETGDGQFLWRPLESGKMMRVNAYHDVNPKGFGLMQRERNFESYQDLTARFELRPSVWVKPEGNWGSGSVELVQLPTNIEYTDNVVTFWVPSRPPQPGQPLDLAYEMNWLTNEVSSAALGHVRATRVGLVPTGAPGQPRNLRFVIDFSGKAVESLSAGEQLDAEVNCSEGTRRIADTVVKNQINGTWRLVVEIAAPTKAVDLRALLKRRGQPMTETWTTTWQP